MLITKLLWLLTFLSTLLVSNKFQNSRAELQADEGPVSVLWSNYSQPTRPKCSNYTKLVILQTGLQLFTLYSYLLHLDVKTQQKMGNVPGWGLQEKKMKIDLDIVNIKFRWTYSVEFWCNRLCICRLINFGRRFIHTGGLYL